ncbi:hypothetical protein TPHA_0I00620 [Tetrapisispora phaffii CBS 4417]|uniref:Uncharacterized protein n=1 Tax=Tetrapisispora phaffii (strain ATCC 24235 / CBS 4417 / NBRC 1672 / NRRL Y-8282 / UCD 70-5) TaxID=1071381 RepID=G8BXE0_TETPH|nr:hypothetical protein TPHA_0I00620 [Tetrapisispora phaffii CBS 4417]CCE64568.1 hypothetical protein TPHA_0I00620 [Tetrapisispora phaffii CBS 4417]
MTHSLALVADSFHMLNDIFSLIVALWAVNVAKTRKPDEKYTYGWKRAEILGALINSVFLIALCVSIFIEAIQRLFEPQEIGNPYLVLSVGAAGLASNIIGLFLFHDVGHGAHSHSHGDSHDDLEDYGELHDESSHSHATSQPTEHSHSHSLSPTPEETPSSSGSITNVIPQVIVDNEASHLLAGTNNNHNAHLEQRSNTHIGHSHGSMNMQGVFLHVLGDALGNIGVIVAALFIWKTDYSWRFYADPLVSLVITVIIFSSAMPLSRKASKILLQATPSTIASQSVQTDILAIPGVVSVHDFHIWNLTESLFIASVHVKVDATPENFTSIAKLIRNVFHNYNIHSATVQPEFINSSITADQNKKFSILAGSSTESSTALEITNGTQDVIRPSQNRYGSTQDQSNCLVDNLSNCNTDDCLPK